MPRVDYPGAARPPYYDRNPSHQFLGYGAIHLPQHASTVRATHTISSGSKAYLESAYLDIVLSLTVNSNNLKQLTVGFIPSGGSSQVLMRVRLQDNHQTVGDRATETWGLSLLGLEGDTFEIVTEDLSTDSDADYQGNIKLTEFDE